MFGKSVDDFIKEQRNRLSTEKIKLRHSDEHTSPHAEKNDCEKPIFNHQNVDSEEKENVPYNSSSATLLRNVKSATAKRLVNTMMEKLLEKQMYEIDNGGPSSQNCTIKSSENLRSLSRISLPESDLNTSCSKHDDDFYSCTDDDFEKRSLDFNESRPSSRSACVRIHSTNEYQNNNSQLDDNFFSDASKNLRPADLIKQLNALIDQKTIKLNELESPPKYNRSASVENFIMHWENELDKKKYDFKMNVDGDDILRKDKVPTAKNLIAHLENLLNKRYIKTSESLSEDEPELSQDKDEPTMLRYGEFSPNNPKMRVATQPYLGLGEYEHRKEFLMQQRKAEYQQYTEKVKHAAEQDNAFIRNNFRGSRPVSNSRDKAVQTDIQDVNTRLIQYDCPSQNAVEKQKSPRGRGVKIDNVQIETQNNIIIPGHSRYLDKVGSLNTSSPRAKLMADLQSSYFPTLLGYTANHSGDDDRLEKVRRQEKYLAELRQQIDEKQRLLSKHKEQERREQDMAGRRLESQLRDINIDEKQIMGRQSYSTDLPQTNSRDFDNKSDKTYNRNNRWSEGRYKSRTLESSLTHHSDPSEKKYTSRHVHLSSPPLSRRDTRPPYSFNIPSNSVFANSLPVKDSLDKNNSKLVTNSSINLTTNDNKKRVIHSTKFDESMPIPVLKAQSPVAKELVNAVAIQSNYRTSDAMRKLEDKWQIPAVQKNIIKSAERLAEGNNQGILTQLGAIRLQLQQEQLRLDETLRKRGTSQTVVQADVHRNLN